MKVRAKDKRYHEKFMEDVEKHLGSCNKVTKMLELLASGDSVEDSKIAKLALTLPNLETQHATLVEHALLFGFVDKPKDASASKRVAPTENGGKKKKTKRARKAT